MVALRDLGVSGRYGIFMGFNFCPECGSEIGAGDLFCSRCGTSAKNATEAPPASRQTARWAGFATLVLLLGVGGGFWANERSGPEERALKPGERRTAAGAVVPVQAPPQASTPRRMELPQDIRDFIAHQAAEAAKTPDDATAWAKLAGVYYRASRLDPLMCPWP